MVNKELNKIKVDRAKKWFAKVPNAENIDLETRWLGALVFWHSRSLR